MNYTPRPRRRPEWHTVFIYNRLTNQWEKIAIIKSPGLTNLFLTAIRKLYGNNGIRTREGQKATLPPSEGRPPTDAEMEILNR